MGRVLSFSKNIVDLLTHLELLMKDFTLIDDAFCKIFSEALLSLCHILYLDFQ